jgi:CBS domain-containing protein
MAAEFSHHPHLTWLTKIFKAESDHDWGKLLQKASTVPESTQWNQFLSDVHLRDVIDTSKVLHIYEHDQNIAYVLTELLQHKISSAPVVRKGTSEIVGIIRLLDIIVFIIGTGGADLAQPIFSVMNLSTRSTHRIVDINTSLLVVMDIFARGAIDSICVVDTVTTQVSASRLVGYITPSLIVRWITETGRSRLPSKALAVKVRNFKSPIMKTVHCVSPKSTMAQAFEAMWKNKISAVAVVDDSEKLIGTISASDIAYLDISKSLHALEKMPSGSHVMFSDPHFLAQFKRPISEILEEQLNDPHGSGNHELLVHNVATSQMTCSPEDTLELVLDKVTTKKVHRIWIVDELSKKPLGVITLAELLAELEFEL